MVEETVISVDIGTSGVRSCVFTLTGKLIAHAYEEYPSYFSNSYPLKTISNKHRFIFVEQSPEHWYKLVRKTLLKIKKKSRNVTALSFTNQRETFVPLDKNMKPLGRAIVWQDRRAAPICESLKKSSLADTIRELTGLMIDPYFTLPKILWLKENSPKLFEEIYKILLVQDYILYRMTDEIVIDFSNASRTMAFDIRKREWSDKICSELGINKEIFPDVKKAGSIIGELSKKSAKSTGLPANIPVILGGGDQQCAVLGVGAVKTTDVKLTTGTGSFILRPLEDIPAMKDTPLIVSNHVQDNLYIIEASVFTTGAAYRWLRELIGHKDYKLLDKSAAKVAPGSDGVRIVPHFSGAGAPYWNPEAKASITGLTLEHNYGHLARAIMEGVSLEIKTNLELMSRFGSIDEVRLTGGITKSELWMKILTDILGIKTIVPRIGEATALGTAIVAAVGTKFFRNYNEAVSAMVKISRVYEPKVNPEL